MDVFRFASFDRLPVTHGLSTRNQELPAEGDIAHAPGTCARQIEVNRNRFLDRLGIDAASLTLGRQVHGANVSTVTRADRGKGRYPRFDAIPDSDGLMTSDPEVALGLIVADCVPVMIYDEVRHAIALVHAGWRGTVQGIVANAVRGMERAFGSRASRLHVGIGPSIGPCCYEVGDDVIEPWLATRRQGVESAVIERSPRQHFDLWRANELILVQSGVDPERIEIAGICTQCDPSGRFFSHRAAMAGERPRGRMMMVAKLDSVS
ncbi:MAG: peptidoglycan editing factor PgeF [Chloroflexota bacterium]